jgi:hypothetical protein
MKGLSVCIHSGVRAREASNFNTDATMSSTVDIDIFISCYHKKSIERC